MDTKNIEKIRNFQWEKYIGEIYDLCFRVIDIFREEKACLKLNSPIKIFGDLHGQLFDLIRLINLTGNPFVNENENLNQWTYLFLGNYVDMGPFSL